MGRGISSSTSPVLLETHRDQMEEDIPFLGLRIRISIPA